MVVVTHSKLGGVVNVATLDFWLLALLAGLAHRRYIAFEVLSRVV